MRRGGWGVEFDSAAVEKAIHEGAVEGLKECIENLKQRSQALVPYETGALHDTAAVEVDEETLSARLSYGDAEVEYALAQHEAVNIRHADGRSAKYIQRPLDEQGANYLRLIGEKIRKRFRR